MCTCVVCSLYSICTGETIGEAAIRETLEETGVQCEFVSVLCFRHMTSYRFGCDDIYFVCHLRPLSDNITIDKNEIANCKWISVSTSTWHRVTVLYVCVCIEPKKLLSDFNEQ